MAEKYKCSVVLPPELEEAIFRMRTQDQYARCSISEIVRKLVQKGLDAETKSKQAG